MRQLMSYTQLDQLGEFYGIPKHKQNDLRAYLGKGISKNLRDVAIVEEHFESIGMPIPGGFLEHDKAHVEDAQPNILNADAPVQEPQAAAPVTTPENTTPDNTTPYDTTPDLSTSTTSDVSNGEADGKAEGETEGSVPAGNDGDTGAKDLPAGAEKPARATGAKSPKSGKSGK